MASVCTMTDRGGKSCEHLGGYKTINRIPFHGQVPVVTSTVVDAKHQ